MPEENPELTAAANAAASDKITIATEDLAFVLSRMGGERDLYLLPEALQRLSLTDVRHFAIRKLTECAVPFTRAVSCGSESLLPALTSPRAIESGEVSP